MPDTDLSALPVSSDFICAEGLGAIIIVIL